MSATTTAFECSSTAIIKYEKWGGGIKNGKNTERERLIVRRGARARFRATARCIFPSPRPNPTGILEDPPPRTTHTHAHKDNRRLPAINRVRETSGKRPAARHTFVESWYYRCGRFLTGSEIVVENREKETLCSISDRIHIHGRAAKLRGIF